MTLQVPFSELSASNDVLGALATGRIPLRPYEDEAGVVRPIPDALWLLCTQCWSYDVNARPKAAGIALRSCVPDLTSSLISRDDRIVASGGFGEIRRGTLGKRLPPQDVAMKFIRLRMKDKKPRIVHETNVRNRYKISDRFER